MLEAFLKQGDAEPKVCYASLARTTSLPFAHPHCSPRNTSRKSRNAAPLQKIGTKFFAVDENRFLADSTLETKQFMMTHKGQDLFIGVSCSFFQWDVAIIRDDHEWFCAN